MFFSGPVNEESTDDIGSVGNGTDATSRCRGPLHHDLRCLPRNGLNKRGGKRHSTGRL